MTVREGRLTPTLKARLSSCVAQAQWLVAKHGPTLAAGALFLAPLLSGFAVHAKTLATMAPAPSDVPKPPTVRADDGLAGGGFYLEADRLTENQATHHVIAVGSVEIRFRGRVVRADRVDYDTRAGLVVATGRVQALQPDGTAQFADRLSLDKTMSDGFASGFSARLQGHVQIAARKTIRKNGQIVVLDHVIYTPCLACSANGYKHPTWSIRASSVIEDKKRQTLVFKGAVIEVLGQGVLYLPVLRSADPTAVRKSGLLVPALTFSGPRGVSYEQPYYLAISPSQDLLITPQINSAVNPFLSVDWRKRFYSGDVEVRAGYTYDHDFTSNGDKFGVATSRSYILSNGHFDISPEWSWGFTADRTSDKLLFDKYSITDVFTTNQSADRGLYAADDRRLISQIYAVRQDTNDYLSIAAISVQGLRQNDDQSNFPTVAPLIEGRWEAPRSVLGGRLRIDGSAVVLTRDQSLGTTDVSGAAVLPGEDSRRATIGLDWQRNFTLANGLLVQPFVNGRADLFNVQNIPPTRDGATITRGFGTLGANLSYPLVKRGEGVTFFLEPDALIAISPNVVQDARIPNEDSVDFEFDETNLLQANRSPGFDLIEGGQSVTLAGRASAIFDDGRSASVLFGRRLAAESSPYVPGRTGLSTPLSDYIFAADATPWKGIRLFSRLRLDSRSLAVNRFEAGAAFQTDRLEGSISYLREALGPAGVPVDSLDIHQSIYATRHWGVTNYFIVDNGAWRRTEVGVVYRDDCLRVEVVYRDDETFNGTLGPTSSVVLRVKLATLGNSR